MLFSSETTEDALHLALRYLAGIDQTGKAGGHVYLSRPDFRIGKRLAERDSLDEVDRQIAFGIVRRYKAKLEAAGHSLEQMKPQGMKRKPRKRVEAGADGWQLFFPYDPELTKATRIFPERKFVDADKASNRFWQIAYSKAAAEVLADFAVEHRFYLTEKAQGKLDQELKFERQPRPMRADRRVRLGLNAKGQESFFLIWEYSPDLYRAVINIPGARFWAEEAAGKPWVVSLEQHARVERLANEFGFVVETNAEARLRTLRAEVEAQERRVRLEKQAMQTAMQSLESTKIDGKPLFRHQKEGVRIMADWGNAILGDHMGLGKTRTAMKLAECYQRAFGFRVFILCPVGLRNDWRLEAWRQKVDVEIYSWAKLPPVPNVPFILIADEAHYAQNMIAIRTQRFLELARSEQCKGRFCLTGTPMRGSRPVNIFPLLYACGHRLGQDFKAFQLRYCNAHWEQKGKNGRELWDNTGAAYLDELKKDLGDILLQRTKAECLDLPAKTRIIRPVALTPEDAAAYESVLAKCQETYNRRVKEGIISDDASDLVLLGNMRMASSMSKVSAAVEIAEEVLEQGGSIILFTEFAPSAEKLAELLRERNIATELLTGDVPGAKRAAMVERFQAKKSRAWVSTIKAGGVGLTLTAANVSVLLDRPWMIDDAEQAEDRIHRPGQNWPCSVYWLQAHAVDRKIDARLFAQLELREKVLKSGQVATKVLSLKELAHEIVQEAFSGPDAGLLGKMNTHV